MADKTSVKPKGQAAVPFWQMLQSVFPGVQCEHRLSWLTLTRGNEASENEAQIRAALIDHCRSTHLKHPHAGKRECSPELLASQLTAPQRPKLEFDFFIPDLNLAFEFDERQHFTTERAVSLECYKGRVQTSFNVGEWISKCRAIKAVDADPIWRDWQRAYRDAVRNIRAAQHDVMLVRYAYNARPTAEALSKLGATR